MNEIKKVITEKEVLGKMVNIYGTVDGPLFLAKDVAEWIDHSNATEMIRTVDESEKLNSTIFSAGQNREMSFLTEDGFYEVLMQSRKPIAKEFKKKVKEILKDVRKHGFHGTDDFIDIALNDPDRMIAMIQNYKFEKEKRLLAEQQRDEAIKTKAWWISDKKTATAMATASAKSRENEKLKEQIGDSKTYKQVKAIPWLSEFFDMKNVGVYIALGNQLKKMSAAMRYPCRTLDDSRYSQGVKAYHIDMIEALRLKLITDLNMMRKYRI